ncbi:MAG: hypothetical protein K1X36_10065 [Pyrinomonadaceae bacterium]|nr:hypothetical protein [Pyrinomonadaceae bacterium]
MTGRNRITDPNIISAAIRRIGNIVVCRAGLRLTHFATYDILYVRLQSGDSACVRFV